MTRCAAAAFLKWFEVSPYDRVVLQDGLAQLFVMRQRLDCRTP